jgi:hypothetical protein
LQIETRNPRWIWPISEGQGGRCARRSRCSHPSSPALAHWDAVLARPLACCCRQLCGPCSGAGSRAGAGDDPHPRDEPFGRTSQHGVLLRRWAVTPRQRATHHGTAGVWCKPLLKSPKALRSGPARPHERRGRRAAACYQGRVVSALAVALTVR